MQIGEAFARKRKLDYERYYPAHIYTHDRRVPDYYQRQIKEIHSGLEMRWNARDRVWDAWLTLPNGARVMIYILSGVKEINEEFIDDLRTSRRNRGMKGREYQRRCLNRIAAVRAAEERRYLDDVHRGLAEIEAVIHRGRVLVPVGMQL